MSTTQHNKQSLTRYVIRFFLGRDLDGMRRTNATWFRHADRDLTVHGRASRWAHKRHMERAAWRIGTLLIVSSAVYGYIVARTLTTASLVVGGFAAFMFCAWRSYVGIRMYTLNRRVVRPMYQTLSPLAGHPPGDSHSKYITVPHDYATNEKTKVKLKLSPLWEGNITQQKAVSGIVTRRLGGDWDAQYYPHAIPPYAEFKRSPAPPIGVSYADFRPYMDASPANTLVLGIGANKKLISIDLDSESPHIAFSMGPGGGKTSAMRQIIAFLVNHGVERIDIINTKRSGYSWCVGLPGVYVHNTMAVQMEAIHNFRLRMESRYDEIEFDESLVFPRNVLILEEQNQWMSAAKQYWADQRLEMDNDERSRMPRNNPAIGDIGASLFMGRQACMNVLAIYQRMSAKASGDGDMRDNYGAKVLARFSPQAWKILVGTTPIPRSSRINGRAIYVLGDEIHAVQLAYLREATQKDWPGLPKDQWVDEALDYALSGKATANIPGPGTPVISDDELYSLRELADNNVIPIRYGALRKARTRDKQFPEPIKRNGIMVYSPEAVKTWHQERKAI